jgi:hypothetical protein
VGELGEWRTTAEWDWVKIGDGFRLHAVHAITNEDTVDDDWIGYGTTACGRGGTLSIPGLFSRMGSVRCETCCNRTGLPGGNGSPKNDEQSRSLVEARIAALGQLGRDS